MLSDTRHCFHVAVMALSLLMPACLNAWAGPSDPNGPAMAHGIIPEYDRKLDSVVVSMETSSKDLSLHEGLINALPPYTRIIMLLPESRVETINAELARLSPGQKVSMVPFRSKRGMKARAYVLASGGGKLKKRKLGDTPVPRGTVWAQDLFEPAVGQGGMARLLAPYMHKMFVKASRGAPAFRDNAFLDKLLLYNLDAQRLPLVFKGGNILVDTLEGQSLAFCGGDIIRDTVRTMKALGEPASADVVLNMLSGSLGVDRVVVLSSEQRQPRLMFHLDQAMVLLPGGVAAVTRIVGDIGSNKDVADVARLLAEIRGRLTALGYSIIHMEASVDDVLNYRYHVNGVPYVNKATGGREFLMPAFKSSHEGDETYKRSAQRLEAIGYRVIPVPTTANERHGGLHCLINVIS